MFIKTILGWRQLSPREFTKGEPHIVYDGGFPSEDLCKFVNRMKDQMIYFDDGERMRYSKYA